MVPLMIDFEDKLVVIYGGGRVGLRKARAFCRAGAKVKVVSKTFSRGFDSLQTERIKAGSLEALRAMDGAFMVVAATDDPDENRRIARTCRTRSIMCNSVDDTGSEVYFSSSVERGPLTIGISTRGESPALSKAVRIRIEEVIGPEWGRMAVLQAHVRSKLKESRLSQPSRRKVIYRVLHDKQIWKALEEDDMKRARELASKRYLGDRN